MLGQSSRALHTVTKDLESLASVFLCYFYWGLQMELSQQTFGVCVVSDLRLSEEGENAEHLAESGPAFGELSWGQGLVHPC